MSCTLKSGEENKFYVMYLTAILKKTIVVILRFSIRKRIAGFAFKACYLPIK